MTLFRYNDNQRREILGCFAGALKFGTQSPTDAEIIGGLEGWANAYITRRRMMTVEGIKKRLDALEVVLVLLHKPDDAPHRDRIRREVDLWTDEFNLIDRPKKHRARLRFMTDALSLFTNLDEVSPFVEQVALSDSDSAVRRFFESAIAPVCEAAGEPIKIRAAINAFAAFKEEMFSAEIEWISERIEYAANAAKT